MSSPTCILATQDDDLTIRQAAQSVHVRPAALIRGSDSFWRIEEDAHAASKGLHF